MQGHESTILFKLLYEEYVQELSAGFDLNYNSLCQNKGLEMGLCFC